MKKVVVLMLVLTMMVSGLVGLVGCSTQADSPSVTSEVSESSSVTDTAAVTAAVATDASENSIGENEPTGKLLCGAAIRDITPTIDNGILPIDQQTNFRLSEYLDVLDPLNVRAIAVSDGENISLIMCFDMGGVPYPEKFVPALAEHVNLPREAIFVTATHTHAAPWLFSDYDTSEETGQKMQKFSDLIMEKMLEAADEALNNMQPAKVGIGSTNSYINTNRNKTFISTDENGNEYTYGFLGYNGEGISDKTLTAIRFDDASGNPIAFLINYPVHCTVTYMNTDVNGELGISSDIAGRISMNLEDEYEGAVAMWTSGAAGDQNPIAQCFQYYPVPGTGDIVGGTHAIVPDGASEILDFVANNHYADVLVALETIKDTTDAVSISYAFDIVNTPGRNVEVISNNGPGRTECEYSDGDDYKIGMQILNIGDITFVGISGELFASIGMQLKEASDSKQTIIVNHVKNGEVSSGYIYDDAAFPNNAYGVSTSSQKPGYVQDALTNMMQKLLEETK